MATATSSHSPALTSQCHCRAVTIHLPDQPTKTNECRCSACYKLGAMWTYFPRKDVRVMIDLPSGTSLAGKIGAAPTGENNSEESAKNDSSTNAEGVAQGIASLSVTDGKREKEEASEQKGPQQAQFVYYDPVTSAGLDTYVRSDVENLEGGKTGIAFMRCKQCGSLTHWWGTEDSEKRRMGVNARLMDEDFVWGEKVERKVSRC